MNAIAQDCNCVDCGDPIPPFSVSQFTFEVSGATNDQLSNPNQGVCGIIVEFEFDFIWDLEMTLTSPSGQSVVLIGENTAIGNFTTLNADWDILFLPCGETPNPDIDEINGGFFEPQWTNEQDWVSSGHYSGSYHPFNGCLENLNAGDVNGTWTLDIDNQYPIPGAGNLLDLQVIFCDDTGLNCNSCGADAGILSDDPVLILSCPEDPSLVFDLEPMYTDMPPDPTEYGYTYVIGVGGFGEVEAFETVPDLTDRPPGTYRICGLSYLLEDESEIPTPDGYSIGDLRSDIESLNPAFCADMTTNCISVIIEPPPMLDSISVPDTLFCDQNSITINAFPTESFYSASWDTTNGNIDSGANTFTPVVTAAGTYIITISDIGTGCSSLDTVEVVQSIAIPSAIALVGDTLTCSLTSVILEGNMSTGLNSLEFEWQNSAADIIGTDETVTVSAAGAYELLVTDISNGCQDSVTVIVEENKEQPNALAVSPDTLNCIQETVVLDGSGSTGNGTLTYQWASTTQVLDTAVDQTVGNAGSHSLIVEQSSNGCLDTAYVDVFLNEATPTAQLILPDSIDCSGMPVMLDGSLSTGDNPLSYQWEDASETVIAFTDTTSVFTIGDFTLFVTDIVSGCQDSIEVTVYENINPPNADTTIDGQLGCDQSSVELDASLSTGVGNLSFIWEDTLGQFLGNGVSYNADSAGDYVLIVTDETNGCQDSLRTTVPPSPDAPEAIISELDTLTCAVTSFTLSGNTSTGPNNLFYTWKNNGLIVGVNETFMVNDTGVYTLIVTDQISNCTDSISVDVIELQDFPIVDIVASDTLLTCIEDVVTIDASASSSSSSVSFLWQTTEGINVTINPFFDINVPNVYVLTVTDDATGCTSQDSIEITTQVDLPIPTVMLNGDLTCIDTIVTANGISSTGIGELLYEWNNDAGQQIGDTSFVSISEIGDYWLVVTDELNGCKDSVEFQVNELVNFPAASASVNALLTCEQTQVTLDASTSTGTGDLYFEWQNINGDSIASGMQTSVDSPGEYTLVLTETQSGCSDTSMVVVMQSADTPLAIIEGLDTLNCTQSDMVLNASTSTGTGNLSYEWQLNGSIIGSDTTLYVFEAGEYLLIINDEGSDCKDTTSVIVIEELTTPQAVITGIDTFTCSLSIFNLSANNSISTNSLTYEWYDFENTPIGTDSVLTVTSSGNYSLIVTDVISNCTNTDSVMLIGNSNPPIASASVSNDLSCAVSTAILDGTGSTGTGALGYYWENETDEIIGNMPMITIEESGEYQLFVYDSLSMCIDSSTIIVVEEAGTVNAVIAISNPLDCDNGEATLSATSSTGTGTLTYAWQDTLGNVLGIDSTLLINTENVYILIALDIANGCQDTTELAVSQTSGDLDAAINGTDLLSCNNPTILVATTTSTSTMLAYEWQNSDLDSLGEEQNFSVSETGMYILIITDLANGCVASDTITMIENPSNPIAVISPPDTLTCDQPTITLNGANSNYESLASFEWLHEETGNNEENDSTFTVTAPGIYTLYLSNFATLCIDTATVEVIQNIEQPTATITGDTLLNCQNTTLTLDGGLSNGQGNLSYDWNNGLSNDDSLIVNTVGIYTLVLTDDSNGCLDTMSVIVDENVNTPIANILGFDTLSCQVSIVNLVGEDLTASADVSYIWQDDMNNELGTGSSYQVTSAGNYTLVLTDTTSFCIDSTSIFIPQSMDVPQIILSAIDTLTCLNTIVTLDASSSTSGTGISYQWQDEVGMLLNDTTILDVTTGGVYQFIIMSGQNSCSDTVSVSVVENVVFPSAIIELPDTIGCDNNGVLLDGSTSMGDGQLAFEWFDPSLTVIGDLDTAQAISSGFYTLIVENENNGCSDTTMVEVIASNDLPIAEAGLPDTLTCAQTSVTLDASASIIETNFSYQWLDPTDSEISTDLTVDVSTGGIYTFVLTDNSSNCIGTDIVEIIESTEPPTAAIIVNGSLGCSGDTLMLDGETSSPFDELFFEWTTMDGQIISDQNLANVHVNQAGIYQLLVTNVENNCEDSTTVLVEQNAVSPTIQFETPSALSCQDSIVQIDATASVSGNNFMVEWMSNPQGGLVENTDGLMPTVNQAGTYVLTITDIDSNCSSSDSVEVIIDELVPIVSAGANQMISCGAASSTLNASVEPVGNYTYEWSTMDGTIVVGEMTLTPTVSETGTYSVIVTNQDNGCTETDEVVITQSGIFDLDTEIIVNPPSCFDENDASITFVDSSALGATPYIYAFDETNFSSNNTFQNLEAGTYPITIQDANGCEADTIITIENPIDLEVTLGEDVILQFGDSIQLNAAVNIPMILIDSIEWTPMITCEVCLGPFVKPESTTYYTVTVEDENGCTDSDDIIVNVVKDRLIFIPTIFSPNGDGFNDVFTINGGTGVVGIKSFYIFNRWGEIVHEQTNFLPNDPAYGWDGTFKGKPLNPAIFVYYAEVEFVDGSTEIYKGDLTLFH